MVSPATDVKAPNLTVAAEIKDGRVARAGYVNRRIGSIAEDESVWLTCKDVPAGNVTALVKAGYGGEARAGEDDVSKLPIVPDKPPAMMDCVFPVADKHALRIDAERAGEGRPRMVDDCERAVFGQEKAVSDDACGELSGNVAARVDRLDSSDSSSRYIELGAIRTGPCGEKSVHNSLSQHRSGKHGAGN